MPDHPIEDQLPIELNTREAVDVAYASELAHVAHTLGRGIPVLVECEKDLVPYFFLQVHRRLQQAGLKCFLVDGRACQQAMQQHMHVTLMTATTVHLREEVRGAVERKVFALPHLDLLTCGPSGLTTEGREVIPLLHENPGLVCLAFRDPSSSLPAAVEELFPCRVTVLGVRRERMPHLITRAESRKLGRPFNLARLHRHVSGLNAVRLRKLLSTLEGEDYPDDPAPVLRQLRQATLTGQLTVPALDLDRDVGGYAEMKRLLHEELLDVLGILDETSTDAELERLEELLPRGILLAGPGTGKLFCARALAGSLGAALLVTSGPELKSRFVGGSEENLRRIFHQARRVAPAVLVFDELDSFASTRITGGTGVEQSMLTQLLIEMGRLPREERVFVVGTTDVPEQLDQALIRPGRFELLVRFLYPDAEDRREILKIHNHKLRLHLTEEALDRAVEQTERDVPEHPGTRYGGGQLYALCRLLARGRLRQQRTDACGPEDVDQALATLRKFTLQAPTPPKS